MPFVKICVTKEGDSPSVEQKEKMISGVTKLISEMLKILLLSSTR